MANTNLDVILSSMGRSQDPNYDDILSGMGGAQPGGPFIPAPVFTVQPTISPSSGTAGVTTFTATPGTVTGGSITSRAWLLNGTAISSGLTAAPTSEGALTYQEYATGAGGPAGSTVRSAAIAAGNVTPTPTPASTLNTFMTADIDPANERDDEPLYALLLADQTRFNIVGLVADAPAGLVSGYQALTNAYDTDRPNLLAYGTASQFKTKAQLDAITVQGSPNDNPAVGYYSDFTSSSQAIAAHRAAQALIVAADAFGTTTGTPTSNPGGKLWVVVGGGWTTIAQALYEAIVLGQSPNFLKKIAIVGQTKHNSNATRNAWKYIASNQWQEVGVPGLFGDMWAVIGGWQWHALNRDNGGSDVTFWRSVTTGSAMGAALESERLASDYKTEYFRAADAAAWFWLSEALRLQNFDPTNTSNKMGPYRLYNDGTGWPYNRSPALWGPSNASGGWPTGAGFDTKYSPTQWGPAENINSQATALTVIAVDAADNWYAQAGAMMNRFKATGAATAPVFTADPVVTGTPAEGSTLSCSAGTVTGSPTPTRTYQWRSGGSAISGATNSTYVVPSGAGGSVIDCLVTATNTAGTASRDSNDVTIAMPGGEDADATAWMATFATAPATADRTAYDTFVKSMKSSGVWAKRDVVAVLAAKDEAGALTGVKRRVAATKSGTVTHTPGVGFLASGGGYLDPGINFGDGGTYNWQRDSANLAIYVMGDGAQTTAARAAGTVANSQVSITNSSSSGLFSARINQTTGTATTATTGHAVKEYYSGNREIAASITLTQGEAELANNGPHPSIAVANSPFRYLADGSGNSYSVPIGYIGAGGSLTLAERNAERTAVRTLITALGGTP